MTPLYNYCDTQGRMEAEPTSLRRTNQGLQKAGPHSDDAVRLPRNRQFVRGA